MQAQKIYHDSKHRVILPVYALEPSAEDEAIVPTVRPSASEELKGLRILVAEDQEDSAEALRILLTRLGGEAEVTNDGKSALEKLKSEKFDLILSDVGMPEMSGYELMQAWRQIERERRAPRIPAVALTAYARPKDRARAGSGLQQPNRETGRSPGVDRGDPLAAQLIVMRKYRN